MALIHHWKLDDTAPVTAYQDDVGGEHGTAVGTVTPEQASLDGLGTQVATAGATSGILVSNPALSFSGEFAISFWATLTNFSANQFLYQAITATDYLEIRTTRETRARVAGGATYRWNTAAAISAATPIHFVFTRDSSNDLFVYVNKVAQTMTTTGTNGANNHLIGYIAGGASSGYSGGGLQDDFRIYDNYLDSSAVEAIYDAAFIAPTTGNRALARDPGWAPASTPVGGDVAF